MHSHHSHSGQYISHGAGSLESMVAAARARGFAQYCLTEHMPRLNEQFLYPEEIEKKYSVANLEADFRGFLRHARQIQASVNHGTWSDASIGLEAGQKKDTNAEKGEGTKPSLDTVKDAAPNGGFSILVGFEVEGLDDAHIAAAKDILDEGVTDMCVGSVHYVHGIPIDFDRALWLKARDVCVPATTRQLYCDYFDLQYKVLTELKPHVIGHFDLIRLWEDLSEIDPTTGKAAGEISVEKDWPEVWAAVTRNIEFVVSYGGLFELNSAAIRKGWASPYPRPDMARVIKSMGGRFCLSDDAHTTAQIGLNYGKMWAYVVEELGLSHVYHLAVVDGTTQVVEDSVAELSRSPFWN